MNSADYLQQLMALKPTGRAWPDDPATRQNQTLAALGEELARLDARARGLTEELDPELTYELLVDFERNFGLPEACKVTPETLAGRRFALHEKITRQGTQSRDYFIQVARALGFTITITEFDTHSVNSAVNQPLNNETWRSAFRVNAPQQIVSRKTVQSGVNEALASWGNDLLECVINRLKPAHTRVIFAYQ